MNRVFHYTTRDLHLEAILESGELRPSAAGGMIYERPMVWFSKNPVMEITAGCNQGLFGCVRFALPARDKRLLPWKDACERAGIDWWWVDALELVGRNMGSSPSDWLGVDGVVPLYDLEIETLENGSWVPLVTENQP